MAAFKQTALRAASAVLPERVQDSLVPRFCEDLRSQLEEGLTDGFLESLLRGMQAAFALSRNYRRNIEDFSAVFVFRTRNNRVGATAVFRNGSLAVEPEPRPAFDTRITFRDAAGLRYSLLAGDNNILETMLSDPVDAEGNLSNLYRFGYLAKELTLQLGIP